MGSWTWYIITWSPQNYSCSEPSVPSITDHRHNTSCTSVRKPVLQIVAIDSQRKRHKCHILRKRRQHFYSVSGIFLSFLEGWHGHVFWSCFTSRLRDVFFQHSFLKIEYTKNASERLSPFFCKKKTCRCTLLVLNVAVAKQGRPIGTVYNLIQLH